jgi:hypothetical protein
LIFRHVAAVSRDRAIAQVVSELTGGWALLTPAQVDT